ncbi:MAG: cytochrome B, partial [Thiomonas sp. 14-66-4]
AVVRRKNLVAAMITGDKLVEVPVPATRDTALMRLLAAVLLTLGVALAWWVSSLGAVGGY